MSMSPTQERIVDLSNRAGTLRERLQVASNREPLEAELAATEAALVEARAEEKRQAEHAAGFVDRHRERQAQLREDHELRADARAA